MTTLECEEETAVLKMDHDCVPGEVGEKCIHLVPSVFHLILLIHTARLVDVRTHVQEEEPTRNIPTPVFTEVDAEGGT